MSLLVWLPLISDYKNQGLSDLKFSQVDVNTTTLSSTGKIGSTCYSNPSNTAGGLISDKTINLGTKLSMCCWFKFSSLMAASELGAAMGGQHRYENNTGMGLTVKYKSASTGYLSLNTGNGSSRTYNTYCGSTLLNANTWYHVAFTYDGSTIKLYVNGNLDGSHNYTGQSNPADYIIIGSWSLNGTSGATIHANYKLFGNINDFRIYNHVLNSKEIELLAQGLIAHYPLKGIGRINYLQGSEKYTKENPLIRNVTDSTVWNDSYVYYDLTDLSVTIPVDGTYYIVMDTDGNPSAHTTSGATASQRKVGMWLQNTSTSTHYFWAGYGTGAGGEKYGYFTVPAGTYRMRTNLYAADQINYQVKIWNMRIVRGEYDPNDPWSPNPDDKLYSLMRFDNIPSIDGSGYGNNLTQVGSINIENNTPRYRSSTDFNQSGYLKKDDFNITTNQFTVSFWINTPYTTNNQHFLFGTHNNWTANGFAAWRDKNATHYSTIIKSSAESSYKGISFQPDYNIWTHITYVYTGTEFIYYKNGAEQSRVTYGLNGTISHPVLYLGNSRYSDAPASEIDEAMLSDFRFYASPLSSSDIKNLYESSASLTKDGKFLAYEFYENKQNSITQEGVAASSGFNDRNIPTYEMEIKGLEDGSTWARIHHLDIKQDKTFFANAAEVGECLNKPNRYSRMNIADKFKSNGTYEYMLTYPTMKKTLPRGYSKLEYIEATGTQYIKTGVTGIGRWELDIEFKTGLTHRQLMGYGGSGQEYWGVQVHGGYGVHEESTLVGVMAGKRDTVVHCFGENSEYSIWVQNESVNVSSKDVSADEYQLFTIMDSPNFMCYAKLYRCKCIQNNVLIRDFIPAMRNSDNVIGLYDIVNGVFYTNAGTGVFYCNFTWLDYIQSNSNQYLNIGYTANLNLKIDVELAVMSSLPSSGYLGVLGNSGGWEMNLVVDSAGLRWVGEKSQMYRPSYEKGKKYHLVATQSSLAKDGILISKESDSNTQTYGSVYLFKSYPSPSASVRIYSCKIYDGGTLVRDLLPCISNNVVGMYDKVTKTFYSNSGTGNFIAGYRGGDYQWLEYIESSGTQYINTGITGKSGVDIEATLSWTDGSGDMTFIGSRAGDVRFYPIHYYGKISYGYGAFVQGQTATTVGTAYTVNSHMHAGSQKVTVNGTTFLNNTNATSYNTGIPMYVFACNENGVANYFSKNRLYQLKIYTDNTLIRDMVPCISPSGKVGMYDKVTKRFYGNSGTGNLIAGPTKDSLPLYNRWVQTSSPSATSVTGFKPINTAWTAHNAGIRTHGTSSLYNCDSGATWYAPIGQYAIWETGIPAADGTPQTETELWVRTDRFDSANQLKIYDGFITANDYIEI